MIHGRFHSYTGITKTQRYWYVSILPITFLLLKIKTFKMLLLLLILELICTTFSLYLSIASD